MKIDQQLKLNFIVVTILVIVAFIVATISFLRIQRDSHHLSDVELPLEQAVLEMEIRSGEMTRSILEYVIKQDPASLTAIQNSHLNFEHYASIALEHSKTDKEIKLIQTSLLIYMEMKALVDKISLISKEQVSLLRDLREKAAKIRLMLDKQIVPLLLKNNHPADHLKTVYELKSKMSDSFFFIYNYVQAVDQTCQKNFKDCYAEYHLLMEKLYQADMSNTEIKALKQIDDSFQSAYLQSLNIINISDELNLLLDRLSSELQRFKQTIVNEIQTQLRHNTRQAANNVEEALNHAFIILAGITIIVILVYFLTNRSLGKIVNEGTSCLLKGINDIQNGNMDTYIHMPGQNELTEVGDFFNEAIDKLRRDDQKIKNLLKQNQLILDSSGDGIYGIDTEGNTTFINQTATRLIGWTETEMIGRNQHDLIHHTRVDGSKYPMDECPVGKVMISGKSITLDNEIFWRKDGSSFPVEYTASPIEENGEVIGAVLLFRDITQRKLDEDRIRLLAMTDQLTGLANRHQFDKSLIDAVKWAKRTNRRFALLMLDLDYFKNINDTYGHQVGDALLVTIAQLMKQSCRETDVIARLGGDEFAIILNHIETPDSAHRPVEKILDLIKQPYEVEGFILQVSVSIGISFYPDDSSNTEQLIRMSDLALYKAKDNGRSTYHFYKKSDE